MNPPADYILSVSSSFSGLWSSLNAIAFEFLQRTLLLSPALAIISLSGVRRTTLAVHPTPPATSSGPP